MTRQAGIKTAKLYSGAYQLYYKHLSPLILKVDTHAWQAFLPSGAFANATSKAQCVVLTCLEIDNTPSIDEDEVTKKNVNWWYNLAEFQWLKKMILP